MEDLDKVEEVVDGVEEFNEAEEDISRVRDKDDGNDDFSDEGSTASRRDFQLVMLVLMLDIGSRRRCWLLDIITCR